MFGGSNSIFGNNNTQGTNNLFGKPQQPANNLFGQSQQGQQQGQSNLFGNKTGGNLFGNTQANTGGNNLFGGNNQQQGGNNLFGGGQTTGGNNLFGGNQNTGGNNLFGGGQTTGGNLFGGQTSTGQYGSSNNQGGPINPAQFSQVNEAQLQHLLSSPVDQHQKLFEAFTPDYIRQLVNLYRKTLDPAKVQKLNLNADNPLKNQRLVKVAQSLNIKPQVIQLKKLIRDNVEIRVNNLKKKNDDVEQTAMNFSAKVFEKLQKYKQKLVLATAQQKMIDEVKKEVDEIDQQIKEFFKPLFNSYHNKNNYSFVDPDPFCLKVSEIVLRNMNYLDNRMDQLLACQAQIEENLDTAQVISDLVEYFENVALVVKEFSDKFNNYKRKIVYKTNHVSPDDMLKKISDKAHSTVNRQMESYFLVKEIESILYKRDDGLKI